ncbi:unnamed protein product [Allacma fusca]|uniref:Glutamate decarboxylase n=1 Tax=Allacma fusca TaxID=39272 RepID=A0A8J2PUT4_9HEXA|nr:unnamed protein product [Allacma fusca]
MDLRFNKVVQTNIVRDSVKKLSLEDKINRGQHGPPATPNPPITYEYFASSPVKSLHDETFRKIVDLLLEKGVFFNSTAERQKPPFKFLAPGDLQKGMNFKLERKSLLEPNDPNAGRQELLECIEFLIDYSPHPSHPFMVSKNSAGLDPYGIIADWLSTTMSQPILSYFLAPVYTLMEFEVYREFRNLIGYPKGQGDGMNLPSHGLGNGFAIQMAIQDKYPGAKGKGLFAVGNPRLVVFVSDQADYSFEKYCIWEGLGSDACIRIQTDDKGRMLVDELRNKLKICERDGIEPIMVVATAGTNVLGAIDPIDEIAQVASDYKLWFHVDGHLAGSCAFSRKHSQRLKGIERSHSCIWSPDKMLAAPFITCIIVTRESNKIKNSFRFDAPVIYDQDPFYDHQKWDTGDNTLQTTRRPDILKIWLMWKVKGSKGLGNQVDGTYRNTRICIHELRNRHPNFVLILPEFDSNLICFYYIPKALRRYLNPDLIGNIPKVNEILKRNKITEKIKNELLLKGKMVISLGELPGRMDLPKFFVMNMNNTAVSRIDITYMLDLIEYHGDQLQTIVARDFETGEQCTVPTLEDSEILMVKKPEVPPRPLKYPDYVSAPIKSMHLELFQRYFKTALELGTYFQDRREESPFHFRTPENLLKKFSFSLVEEETGGENGTFMSVDSIMEIVRGVIFYSARLAHPYYIFQLISGLEPYTMMADYVTACISSPMYTYEDGPVFTIMEQELTTAVGKMVGYPTSVGMSLVGGSGANQLSMALAFNRKFGSVKRNGIHKLTHQGVMFLSEGGHFSVNKGAFFMGIGLDNLVSVKTDQAGKMDPNDLREKVKTALRENKIPFMVIATAGTTTLGSFDPLEEIADICQEYDMWFHVDAAYGGCAAFSESQSSRLKGVDRSDSFTFNGHKMLCAAGYTTSWITRHVKSVEQFAPPPSKQQFRLNPSLYNEKAYDYGETHALTNRRPDVIKMWLLWKVKGMTGLGEQVDKAYSLTNYAYNELLRRSQGNKFVPAISTPPEATNINFFYVPHNLMSKDLSQPEFTEKLVEVQNIILSRLLNKNKLLTSVEPVAKIPAHLVFCLYNTCLSEKDIKYFFDLVEFYGDDASR